MGLFDKKYCDICGEKIGLLGNRKLEDGNLCKNCAKKLSPWFSDRRNSTVAEIKEQLDWREANRGRAAQFRATRSFGEDKKLLLDETHRMFTVTRATTPADDNSDVLDFSAITGCRMDIDESRTELKIETKDSDGKIVSKSYNPPRYEYDYDFYITISVNVPYFNEMRFQINDRSLHVPYRPTASPWSSSGFFSAAHEEPLYDAYYCRYKETCQEICTLLDNIRTGAVSVQQTAAPAQGGSALDLIIPGVSSSPAAAKAVAEVIGITSWRCASCGMTNSGTPTCQNCGKPLSDESVIANLKNIAFAAAMAEGTAPGGAAAPAGAPVQNTAAQGWVCPYCGASNQGKFCESCGAARP